ncbi:Metal-dependent hydrolase, beta-lactamase superfamily II [Carnobacterium iners]|uniref:Metal-dependent hydrolase, beta-lactamase superfamily II n=1 Tax=Carnobacterium iners TaxID=1073423 RepID=A0A1X7N5H7_9LACT|nr:MBL fold metallo-hydrolase [Carnobacterium iners]SEK62361.1 Metal-dependent hydrolase, beta-lactamase superfamily II [Carnobacterium iners]SMH31811.1 Metal-dependent hydrolase, beta-lactamase superfamily II [Carnobacterium iners]
MKSKIIKIGFLFFIGLLLFFLIRPLVSETPEKTKIVIFGLGKADSIYIESENETILIDAGLKSTKEELALKLKAVRVKRLDYLILTHPDKDHVGGASYILDGFEVGKLIQSNHFKDTKREARIQKVVDEKEIENVRLTEDLSFELGTLKVTIITPEENDYKGDNDHSLITLIEDGDLNYLFAGDAEEELLEETLKIDLPKIDLYKVAHHGRENPNSEKFIEKISPKLSVITNSKKDSEVEDLLEKQGSTVMYAFEKDIHLSSDGKEIEYK